MEHNYRWKFLNVPVKDVFTNSYATQSKMKNKKYSIKGSPCFIQYYTFIYICLSCIHVCIYCPYIELLYKNNMIYTVYTVYVQCIFVFIYKIACFAGIFMTYTSTYYESTAGFRGYRRRAEGILEESLHRP